MSLTQPFHGLAGEFLAAAQRYAERPALDIDGQVLTYGELADRAARLARTLRDCNPAESSIAIFARRGITAYSSVLASWMAGRAYVPLNPKFPAERTRQMLTESGSTVLIVGNECLGALDEVLSGLSSPMTIFCPDAHDLGDFAAHWPNHRFLAADAVPSREVVATAPAIDPAATALVVFTSGSTGVPKGVPTSHGNIHEYIMNINTLLELNPDDRVSQAYDLTFDPSVHDMLTCWTAGACLVSIPDRAVMAPARIIQEKRLTTWFSVPSVISMMRRMGMLKEKAFPSLRRSLFCGEPLPAASAIAWQRAAPNSTVENLYGPTETTVILTRYAWKAELGAEQCVNGIVPIGWPLPGQQASVRDTAGLPVLDGEQGELYLSGSQVVGKYWRDAELSRRRFVKLPETGEKIWYRTGDIAMQDTNGCLHFLGRLDEQVKVRGYRIELQEIDCVLRRVSHDEQAVAVPWPVREGNAEGIVAFLRDQDVMREDDILMQMRKAIPEYMVPRKIYLVPELPLNANGKVDRKKLISMLQETTDGAGRFKDQSICDETASSRAGAE